MLQFAKQHLRIDIVDLYGSRECGGITRDGVVYKALEVRLLSMPELGYYADAHPPRGEICVHSPRYAVFVCVLSVLACLHTLCVRNLCA